MKKPFHFKMGLCPIVLSLEEIDHENQKRFAQLYDPIEDKTYTFELPYHVYSLADIKSQHECWEDALAVLKVEWKCPHHEECPIAKRKEKATTQ